MATMTTSFGLNIYWRALQKAKPLWTVLKPLQTVCTDLTASEITGMEVLRVLQK